MTIAIDELEIAKLNATIMQNAPFSIGGVGIQVARWKT